MSLARAAVSGVLTTEPEKRFTPNNAAVTNFTIEVSPGSRNEAPFQINVACWRGMADAAAEQLHKGMEVFVEGRLQVNQFDQGGITRRVYEIDATNIAIGHIEPLVPVSEGGQAAWQGPQQPVAAAARTQAPPVFSGNQAPVSAQAIDEPLTEDDIPF